MIEEKEELQGQLIASGQIVGGLIGCKGEKGDKGDTGNSATITVGTVTTGSPGTQATVTNVGTPTDAIFDFVIPRGQDGSGGGGGGDMYKSTYDKNDNGIVDNAEKVNNHTVLSDVPADAVFTDTTYTAGTGIDITAGVISNTQTSAEWGNISGTLADQTDLKNALDSKGTYSKPSGGIPKTDLANSVQTSLGKADTAIQSSDLSTVATSGSYNDLSNKPTIPTKVSDLTNDSGFINKNVNDLTNYTTTSTLNTLLAGKEKDIPIQDTAPQNPEENDLWIDTSENNRLKYYGGTNWKIVNGQVTGDTLPIGSQIPYGSTTPPTNWLVCDGSAVSRTTYAELFAVIGTSYGAGDGSTTFNLPNKKGRKSVGYDSNDTDFNAIGKKGGEKKHQLTYDELPGQVITGYCAADKETWATGAFGDYSSSAYPTNTVQHSGRGTGDQAHNIEDPFEVDCWIIKAKQSAGLVANVSKIYSTSEDDTYACSYINGIIESGSNANGYYTKYADGTLICRGSIGPVTTNANSGTDTTFSFPATFIDTNYAITITISNGQAYWGDIQVSSGSKNVSSCVLITWNNGGGTNSGQYFDYIAIGRWK